MDAQEQVHVALPEHHLADRHDDLALLREFHGVGEKIDHDLTQTKLIAQKPVDGDALEIHGVADAAGVQGLGKHIVELVPHGPEAEGLVFQLDFSGLDAGHIQNVVDEGQQMRREFVGLIEVLHGRVLLLQLALSQGQHTDDAVHGGADLVGHAGEEGRLGLAGLLDLHKLGLVVLQTLVLVGDVPPKDQVIVVVPAAVGDEADPAAVLHCRLGHQGLGPVPVQVGFPALFALRLIVQPSQQAGGILPQTGEGHAQHLPQVARRVHGHPVPAAQEDADLLALALPLLQEDRFRAPALAGGLVLDLAPQELANEVDRQ